ncbi:MAG TPA: hypothetical protein VGA53_01930 [Candidatus Paceibacterota bacterium]
MCKHIWRFSQEQVESVMDRHGAYFDIGPGEPLFKKEVPNFTVIQIVYKQRSTQCKKDVVPTPHYNH